MPIDFPLFSQYIIYGCFEDFQPLGGFKFDNGWDQQMSYTWASDRWVMPAPYYKTSVVYADLGFDVDYYFLDSNFVDAKPPEDEFSFSLYICLYRKHSPIQWISRAKSYTWIETSSMIEVIISQTRFSFAHAHTHTLFPYLHVQRLFSTMYIFRSIELALLKVRFSLLISGRKIPITTCARARTTNPRPPALPPTAQSQWTAAPGGSPRCGRSRRSGPPGCCPRARPRGRLR